MAKRSQHCNSKEVPMITTVAPAGTFEERQRLSKLALVGELHGSLLCLLRRVSPGRGDELQQEHQ
jgi:hypothetical protein